MKSNSLPIVETVFELPSPAVYAGQAVEIVGSSTVRTYSHGGLWYNSSDDSEIVNWWLPRDATLHVDFENGRFYWDGAAKSISDLTEVAAGGYSLAYDLDFTDTAWVLVEGSFDADNVSSGENFFSWTSGYPSGNRVEIETNDNATSGGQFRIHVLPDADGGAGSVHYPHLGSKDSDDQYYRLNRSGRHRLLTRIASATAIATQADNGELKTEDQNGTEVTAGTFEAPTLLGFACRAWSESNPNAQLESGTLQRVTIWADNLASDYRIAIGRSGRNFPVHLLGDSFLNSYVIVSYLEELLGANGYIGISQDGAGGTTMTMQAARYAADAAKWHDSTLVWCDFGFEPAEDYETAFNSVMSNINHNRWLIMEPAPPFTKYLGTPERDALDAAKAVLRELAGDRWVPTLQPAQSAGNGSPADENNIALGLWPVSLCESDSNFHPNAAGCEFIANLIHSALALRGWA